MSHNPLDTLSNTFHKSNVPVKGAPGLRTVASQNKSAVKFAAIDAVGRAANTAVLAAIKPHMPMMLKGYADHPVANILAANLVNVAIQQTGVGGEKGRLLAHAMIQSAYLDLSRSFKIEKMVEDLINKVPAAALDALREEAAAE